MDQVAPLIGGVFFIIWFLLMIGMIVGWIVFIVAIWRGMKAHESIAGILEEISKNMSREKAGVKDSDQSIP